MPKHAINWFEIPVTDMDRAVAFYEAVLGVPLERMDVGTPVAVFPHDDEGVGGALSLDGRKPSAEGSLVYLEVDGKLQDALDRVPGAGGEVVLPVHGNRQRLRLLRVHHGHRGQQGGASTRPSERRGDSA